MAKKKKEEEEDAWLWMSRPFSPGAVPVGQDSAASMLFGSTTARTKKASSTPFLPFTANPYILRQVFNIPAYIVYGTFLPTPLEQIAFAKDPLGIVPPYVWKGGFHAILDLSATVGDPFGVARAQIQSPHEAAFGRPNPNYWFSEEGLAMTDLFIEAGY